jgi:CBS domain containing-hemolysin-like protein
MTAGKLKNARGKRGYLIFAIVLMLFLLIFDLGLLSISEVSLGRISRVKNRLSARSLADAGVEYYRSLGIVAGDGETLVRLMPGTRPVQVTSRKGEKIYRFTSPPLTSNGYFTLDFYTRDGTITRRACTGHSQGISSGEVPF